MTISPERERQLLASVAYRSDSLRAIQFLLTRVRALERREAELCEMLWMARNYLNNTASGLALYSPLMDQIRDALEGGRDEQVAR